MDGSKNVKDFGTTKLVSSGEGGANVLLWEGGLGGPFYALGREGGN